MIICPGLNQDGGVGMQPPISFLVLSINIDDVILSNEIIFHHVLPQIDPCPPNHLMFVVYLFQCVPQVQLGPNVVLKNLRHLGSI